MPDLKEVSIDKEFEMLEENISIAIKTFSDAYFKIELEHDPTDEIRSDVMFVLSSYLACYIVNGADYYTARDSLKREVERLEFKIARLCIEKHDGE